MMPGPVLYDTVTLRHFAIIRRLDICEELHHSRPAPRWTDEVCNEITRASGRREPGCSDILSASWLGSPVVPSASDLLPIYKIQIGLNGGRVPPTGDLGEAESLHFAEQYSGILATDDAGAFDFAQRRLGAHRVIDSIRILQEAVVEGILAAADAANLANQIRASGRFLRPGHPPTFRPGHF